jgi:hypothetical protein
MKGILMSTEVSPQPCCDACKLYAKEQSDRGRNEAIKIFGLIAVVLSIATYLGALKSAQDNIAEAMKKGALDDLKVSAAASADAAKTEASKAKDNREKADKLYKEAAALKADFGKMIDDTKANQIKITPFDEVFGMNLEKKGAKKIVSGEAPGYVVEQSFGNEVLAVIPFPVDVTSNITDLRHLSAEPIDGNKVKIFAAAKDDKVASLIRIRFYVIYR